MAMGRPFPGLPKRGRLEPMACTEPEGAVRGRGRPHPDAYERGTGMAAVRHIVMGSDSPEDRVVQETAFERAGPNGYDGCNPRTAAAAPPSRASTCAAATLSIQGGMEAAETGR